MKFLFSFAILLCLLQSCNTYYFTTPQPAGGEKLAEIPENLRGTWNCGYDSSGERICDDQIGYLITANEINIKDKNEPITWKIGQDVELLKLDDFFVLNLINKDKMYTSKGKQVESQLYSAVVITESEGAITIWNVDRAWDAKSARKFRKAEPISDKMEMDTMNNESHFILNFSLNKSALEKISLFKPLLILRSDSTMISGDDIDWDRYYTCGEPTFENRAEEREYYRFENKTNRLFEKKMKIDRKIEKLKYKHDFKSIFGDHQKGYALLVTNEFYMDSSRFKMENNFSNNPKKYEVYRLIEYDRDVVPSDYRLLNFSIDSIIPEEIAIDFIRSNKVSFVVFRDKNKAIEEGMTTWNHLSEADKRSLIEILGYRTFE